MTLLADDGAPMLAKDSDSSRLPVEEGIGLSGDVIEEDDAGDGEDDDEEGV